MSGQHYFKCSGCNSWILSVAPGPVCAECSRRKRGGAITAAIVGACLTLGVGCCVIVVNVSHNGDAVDTHAVVRDVIPEFVVGGTHGVDESGRNPQKSDAVEQEGESRIPGRHRSVSFVPPAMIPAIDEGEP